MTATLSANDERIPLLQSKTIRTAYPLCVNRLAYSKTTFTPPIITRGISGSTNVILFTSLSRCSSSKKECRAWLVHSLSSASLHCRLLAVPFTPSQFLALLYILFLSSVCSFLHFFFTDRIFS